MSGARAGVKLFPGRVKVGSFAVGVLTGVVRDAPFVVANYKLIPVSEIEYDEHLRDLSVNSAVERFSPLQGLWLEVDDEDEDGPVQMRVGLHGGYGRALARRSGSGAPILDPLVPEYQIRAMLFGLLGTAGA